MNRKKTEGVPSKPKNFADKNQNVNRKRSRAIRRLSPNTKSKQRAGRPKLANWKYLDSALRLRLAELDSKRFEDFFLHFLNSGVELTVQRKGKAVTRRVISAETYAAGSGKDQKGIDLRVIVEVGEVWCIQCKRHKKWTRCCVCRKSIHTTTAANGKSSVTNIRKRFIASS